MKKIILTISLLSNAMFAQVTPNQLDSMMEKNEHELILNTCFKMIDTAKTANNKQLANNYIASVLEHQDKPKEALVYAVKALRIDGVYTEKVLNNVATIYARLGQYDLAVDNFKKRLTLINPADDNYIITLSNIATIYTVQKKYKVAKTYLDSAFALSPKGNLDMIYGQYGYLYSEQRQYKLAIPFYYKTIAANNTNLNTLQVGYQGLAECYTALCVQDSAFVYFDKYNAVVAQMQESRTNKDMTELFVKYETRDKERQLEIQTAQVGRQQRYIALGVLGGVILIIILVVIYRLYDKIKIEKSIVVDQRAHLAYKNREIEDSILYARGIQEAMLPAINDERVFVMYQPKDIISGDFYWAAEKHGNKYYAVADCTGHGVPGALMSMLCTQLLDEAVERQDSPADILSHVQSGLDAKMKAMGRNDGMEIGLVSINEGNVAFAGIGRSLYVVSKGELTSYKNETFIEVNEGDVIYMSTDGFTDQFGTNGKKFGSKRLKEEMTLCSLQTPENQLKMFTGTLNYWQQDVEQTDDILLMGIKF